MGATIDQLQDTDLVKQLNRDHERLASLRAPWESVWREIDERVNPLGAGGWDGTGTGAGRVRGAGNFDVTAVESLDRFQAAMAAITVPFQSQYIRPRFEDRDLDKLPAVRRWCERAGDRLYAIRYAPHTGFRVQSGEDLRQLGCYGSGPLWSGERKGVGLFYKALHLSECYFDEDFSGQIDTVHRRYTRSARQLEQEFGREALTPRMRRALEQDKAAERFELLHVVRPNPAIEAGALDRRGMPVDSVTVALDEKWVLRRGGFHSMPISVSRHVTGPGDIYGRSPALKVLPTIKGVNAMQQTNLRAGHKLVDPALAFFDDDGITSLVTRPGGANPGLVNERGQLLVAAMPSGAQLPIGLELVESERQVIRTAFLEDFFRILTDPGDRMTATQVLEMVAKQGVLVSPYAGRYETEKQAPVTQRDLELALRAGQIEPFPPEVLEAGAWPRIDYDNPLSRMARAEEAAGLTRWIEAMTPLANVDPGVFDHVDTDAAAPGLADVLGLRPSWIATPDKVAAKRQARAQQQQASAAPGQMADAAGAYLDLARGNQVVAGAAA
ncbi:portal protein [Sphingomonas sp. BK235]|uniref:portal protein n=1 Tax=Sphingomonas sp. BK235 TaxID=2512131 RepID=UPI001043AB8A|nr:portal protein [Sphingomonas sp. BK235]TCP35906.1 head-to-tail connecting protein [Sphingomonas sp. BK235]